VEELFPNRIHPFLSLAASRYFIRLPLALPVGFDVLFYFIHLRQSGHRLIVE